MNTIRKKTYRGIEYIQISDLNEDLRTEISNWLSDEVLIKIKTEDRILRDCIQTKDFIYWYENLYTPVNAVNERGGSKPKVNQESVSLVFER